jgi:hypothetical protein
MKLTKQKLKQIIKEELELVMGKDKEHAMYSSDDELRGLGTNIADLLELTGRVGSHLGEMQARYGELAHMGSYASMAQEAVQTLSDKYKLALDELSRSTERGWYE